MKVSQLAKKEELVYYPSWIAGRPGYADRIRHLFEEFHHEKGMRMTPQRQLILNFLLEAKRHVTEEDIYRALKFNGVGKVTVFRALKMLEDAKLVSKIPGAGKKVLYEVQSERPHHDHLICIECGAVQEIRWPQIEKIQEQKCREMGFHITFHRHEVLGRCRSCTAKKKG